MSYSFADIRSKYLSNSGKPGFDGTLLCFDPGETTGVAVFQAKGEQCVLLQPNQIITWDKVKSELVIENLISWFDAVNPTTVIFESYQVYEWRKDEHSWSQIPTVQVIGCIKTICMLRKIPFYTQTAQIAKSFMTDEKLEQWGFYRPGLRHARDAIRHGLYFLMFGPAANKS